MKKMNYFTLYLCYLKNQLMGIIEYKLDFFIGLLSIIIEQVLSLVFIGVLFSNITSIQKWTFPEILLIYAFSTLGRSIHIIFFDNMWVFGSKYIQQGELDRLLLRPINPYFQLIAEKINYQGIGQIIMGITALAISVTKLQILITPVLLIKIFLFVILSGSIYVFIHLFYMVFSFWMTDSQPIVSAIFSFNQFAQYPLSIFPKAIHIILLFIIPYSFTSFIPSTLLIQQTEFSKFLYITPIISIFLGIISYNFWKIGLKNYKSTGT